MAIHDAYARVTPLELALPGGAWTRDRFAAIREEAEGRGQLEDLDDAGRFVMLGEVGRTLQELRGEGPDGASIHHFSVVLYHSLHLWEGARVVDLLTADFVRTLVEDSWAAPNDAVMPEGGSLDLGYVQLPRHLFWARPQGPDEAAEAIDGVFITVHSDTLSSLVVSGIRDGRPGFSVLPIPDIPCGELSTWATASAREGGQDFAPSLPGAEFDNLFSIETPGEVLKLLSRALFSRAAQPETMGARSAPEEGEREPRQSVFPCRRWESR